MAIGVSPSRICPDQSGFETARRASIAKDLYEPPVKAAKVVARKRDVNSKLQLQAYGKNAKKRLQARLALGMR